MKTTVTVDTQDLRQSFEKRKREREKQMLAVLERVGIRVVELLTSFTGEKNKRGRRTHPGGWADRTFKLATSFGYEVKRTGSGWILTILNDAPHAHLIEAINGMYVVRGVADPGGPVQQALIQAVGEIAPEWRVA